MNFYKIAVVGTLLIGIGSCGQIQTRSDLDALSGVTEDEAKELKNISGSNDDIGVSPAQNPQIPIEVNQLVQKWVNYFQGRGRKYMETYLERSSRYLPMMKAELRSQGLPEDLVYVSLIESGFSHKAHSHASAVGYWQFIRGTGKRYGLKIDAYIDERRDPVLSTQAAGRYFKALHNLFGNWYLSLASYNAGENRIKRAVMKYYTRNFWDLAKRRRLPRETINYVPKFIAATLIAKDPASYGFTDIAYEMPLDYDTIVINKPISLQKLASGINETSYEEMRRLNPMYRTYYVPVEQNKSVEIRVPKGMVRQAVAALDLSYSTPPKYVATEMRYRVRRGDSLSVIARRFRTRVSTLRNLNGLSRRSILRVGQSLRVPERMPNPSIAYEESNPSQSARVQKSSIYHKVKAGENLNLIAKKYGQSVSELRSMNQIGRRSVIYVGQRLLVKQSKSKVHVVKKGETLSHIALKYGINVRRIALANQLSNRSRIMIGSELIIP